MIVYELDAYTGKIRQDLNVLRNFSVTQNLTVGGNASFNSDADISGKLLVSGETSLESNLTTKGDILYQGSRSTVTMISFLNNENNPDGNGIAIGGGGATIIGGGESATIAKNNTAADNEILWLTNDGEVQVLTNLQNGWDYRKTFTFGTDGSLNVEGEVSASQFNGPLNGTALRATNDGNGSNIVDTYLPYTGGKLKGPLYFQSESLPNFSLQYLVGIQPFASGGELGWSSVTDVKVGSASSADAATTAAYPLGFSSREANGTWGNQTGSGITVWNDSSGGSIQFRQDNPVSGQLSLLIDGTVYVNEGSYPVLSTQYVANRPDNPALESNGADSGRNYQVQRRADGLLFVNVPWSDTNTDTLVNQYGTSADVSYKVLLSPGNGNQETVYGVDFWYNPGQSVLYAPTIHAGSEITILYSGSNVNVYSPKHKPSPGDIGANKTIYVHKLSYYNTGYPSYNGDYDSNYSFQLSITVLSTVAGSQAGRTLFDALTTLVNGASATDNYHPVIWIGSRSFGTGNTLAAMRYVNSSSITIQRFGAVSIEHLSTSQYYYNTNSSGYRIVSVATLSDSVSQML